MHKKRDKILNCIIIARIVETLVNYDKKPTVPIAVSSDVKRFFQSRDFSTRYQFRME